MHYIKDNIIYDEDHKKIRDISGIAIFSKEFEEIIKDPKLRILAYNLHSDYIVFCHPDHNPICLHKDKTHIE